ncbi:uncharacterized protein ColKHC_01728 [Colletotrichum higginsianum]|nr:uncharacterized protein ColKHC_01728 [Colletotrichum higginsianum]
MTGDGLSDLFKVSGGKIVYWPDHVYGAFGDAIEMGNCPRLAEPGSFDAERLRLMDVEGSGTANMLYILPGGGARLFYNLAGNAWSDAVFTPTLPATTSPSNIFLLDILGEGTACLRWADASSS